MKNRLELSNKGLSVIEIVFSIFISAVALLTLNVFITQMNNENKKLSDNSNTTRKNYDFLELMNNPTMWKATVLDVKNYAYFSCKLGLNPHPDQVGALDCGNVSSQFRIVNADSSIIYDQNEKDGAGKVVGFTPEGIKCFGFDALAGNDFCPTHYEISWDLPCLNINNCKEPMAQVSVKQITKYQTKTALNSQKAYNLNVNLPQSVAIAPRDSAFLVNINSVGSQIDVLKTDYVVDTFNLKLTSANSSMNSTVSISNNKIVYTPTPNFYGVDKIYYTVEQNLFDKVTKSDGVVWVRVMTPYTWVGEGAVEETSISGKKWYNLYDKRNWCGTVVNNKCNHFDADPRRNMDLLTDAQMRSASLVFNENCVTCSVLLKGMYQFNGVSKITVNSIEMAEAFPGELKQLDNIEIMIVRNSVNRTSTDPALLYGFWQKGGTFIGANSQANMLVDEVAPQNKYLKIDRNGFLAPGSRRITSGTLSINSYGFFGFEGGKFYSPEKVNLISGYNRIGNAKNFFHQNGTFTVVPRWNGGNIMDAPNVSFSDFIVDGAGGFDYGIVGSFNVRDFHFYQPGSENQLRGFIGNGDTGYMYVSRNIYLRGGGGFSVNGMAGWQYAKIVVNSNSDQYIYSNLDLNGNKDRSKIGRLPVLVIDKPSGTLNIKGDLGINTGIDYRSGVIKFYDDEERDIGDRQMIEFSSLWNSMYIKNTSGNELVLPNLEIAPQCSHMVLDTDLRVAGDFIQDKRKYSANCGGYPFGPQTRKIYVEGDVYAKSGGNENDNNGLVTIELTGTKDQNIYGFSDINIQNNVSNFADGVLPVGESPILQTNIPDAKGFLIHVDVNKPNGGNVKMTGAIGFMGRFRIIAGNVDAQEATFSFRNINDCCAPGYAVLDTKASGGKFKIKNLNVQRSLNLAGSSIEVLGDMNFPTNIGAYNAGSIRNGDISLHGDLYYNDNFDRVWTDVNRAKIALVGRHKDQTIYATMTQQANRVGSFEVTIDKEQNAANPLLPGVAKLNCQRYDQSVFYLESLTIEKGTLDMNGCDIKVAKKMEIKLGGVLDRGATPGNVVYGSLTNSGTITPAIVASP